MDFVGAMPTESIAPHNGPDKQTKILSFRPKRATPMNSTIEPYTSDEYRVSSKQMSRRSVDDDSVSDDDDNDDDDDDRDDNAAENSIDDLSTATTPFVELQPKLKVNTNGDLIFEAISQRDEVR